MLFRTTITTDPVLDVIAAASLLSAFFAGRAARASRRTHSAVGQVQDTVNGQLSRALDRRDVAEAASAIAEAATTIAEARADELEEEAK